MKILRLAAVIIAAAALSGCGMIKETASGYYLSRAERTLAGQNPSRADIEKAYADIGRSLDYSPYSRRALEALERLTGRANKTGFARGSELEIAVLKRALRASPDNWQVFSAAVNALSVRGDVYSMQELASRLPAPGAEKGGGRYETAMALALCYASMAPWVESEGYLSLNKDPDTLIEKAREYARVRRRALELRAALVKMEAAEPALRAGAPQALLSSADVALGDLARSGPEAERVYASVARMDAEPAFLKAVGLTVQGNNALVRKDYAGARALYKSAMQNCPGFIDARKQLVEVDFQEGAGLALTGAGVKAGKQLLYRAYDESGAVIAAALENPGWMPFMPGDKFLADTYSIRAAVILSVNAIEKGRLKHKGRLEKEFKDALSEAVRLDPRGGLAKELLERYTKEGF